MSQVAEIIRGALTTSRGWLSRPIAPSAENKILKNTELGMWIAGAVLLLFCAFTYAHAAIHQSRQAAQLNSLRAQIQSRSGAGLLSGSPSASKFSGFFWNTEAADQLWAATAPLGILEIPRLQLSAVAEEGADTDTLDLSVGHVAKTAYPGLPGNSAFAAHRDTYFKNLEDIQIGDQINFKSLDHDYRYQVSSIQIVDGSDTSVLADTGQSTITLVTCYPFHYIGAAPKRFIVTATQTASSDAHTSP